MGWSATTLVATVGTHITSCAIVQPQCKNSLLSDAMRPRYALPRPLLVSCIVHVHLVTGAVRPSYCLWGPGCHTSAALCAPPLQAPPGRCTSAALCAKHKAQCLFRHSTHGSCRSSRLRPIPGVPSAVNFRAACRYHDFVSAGQSKTH